MRSRHLQRVLAEWTNTSIGEVDQRVRGARKAGAIESGPRGHHALDVSFDGAVQHILCLAARRAVDAEVVRIRLNNDCIYVPHHYYPDILPKGMVFSELLKKIMSGEIEAFSIMPDWRDLPDHSHFVVKSIEVGRDGELAFVQIVHWARRVSAPMEFTVIFSSNQDDHAHIFSGGEESHDIAVLLRTGYWFVLPAHYIRLIGKDVETPRSEVKVETVPGGGPLRLRRQTASALNSEA